MNNALRLQHIYGFSRSVASQNVTDSLGFPMQDYSITGNIKQSRLPSGYTELESIILPSGAYIDTGIQANPSKTNTKMRVKLTSISGTTGLFGTRDSSATSTLSYNVFSSVSGSTPPCRFDNVNPSFPYALSVNTWYDIELKHSNLKGQVYINGTLLNTGTNDMSNQDVGNIYIGTFNNQGTAYIPTTPSEWGNVQICYDGTTLSGDLIPCKNSSNVCGLYNLVTNEFKGNAGTGTITAGAVAPTPNAPIDIQGVGDKTENLFNPNNAETRYPNGWFSTGSAISDANNANRTIVIPCSEGDVFTFKHYTQASGSRYFWIYSDTIASGKPCSSMYGDIIGMNAITTTSAPSNAKHIGICFWRTTGGTIQSSADDFVIVKGSTAPTTYIPYGYKVPIVCGSNCGCVDLGTLNWAKTTYGGSFQLDGMKYISVTGNNAYLYGYTNASSGEKTFKIVQNGSVGTFIGVQDSNLLNMTATDIQNCFSGKYFYYQRITDTSWTAPSVVTNYLSAPLYKLGTYGDVASHSGQNVSANCLKVIFDGTESYWGMNYGTGMFHTTINKSVNAPCLSTHFVYNNVQSGLYANLQDKQFAVQIGASSVTTSQIFFKNLSITSVDDWKSWLASLYASDNPLYVIIPLATATSRSETLSNISLVRNDNIVTLATEVQPSAVNYKYRSRTI